MPPLTKDRTGRIQGPVACQQDFDLPADATVYKGGLYRVVDGVLTLPAENAAQDDCITVMALEHKSNQGGQARAKRARCMVDGLALMPKGSLTTSNIGRPVYPMDDGTVTASAPTQASNQRAGVLLAVDGSHAKIKLG